MRKFSQVLDIEKNFIFKFSQNNEVDLVPFFQKLENNRLSHIYFLNTLSYLEYMGSQKIHTIFPTSEYNEFILKHASEEARHAYFFKRKSKELANHYNIFYPVSFSNDQLLGGSSPKIYFKKLLALVRKNIINTQDIKKDRVLIWNYLYVTLLIEIRAYWFYCQYNQFLEDNKYPFNIHRVIREEEGHLNEIYSSLNREDKEFLNRMDYFLKKENVYFLNLLKQWIQN